MRVTSSGKQLSPRLTFALLARLMVLALIIGGQAWRQRVAAEPLGLAHSAPPAAPQSSSREGNDSSGDWALPNFAQRLSLEVANAGAEPVSTLVTLPVSGVATIAPGFPGKLAIAMIMNPPGSAYEAGVVPSQADDLDGDGQPDEFEFPIALAAGEHRRVHIYYSTTLASKITYPQRAHASHAYGYNHQTATLESELIGYRTYGGFLLDVQARTADHPGLYNDLVGFLASHKTFAVGKDVFHVGDTLGLGGLFLRSGNTVYRPPFNVPDYAHRPSPGEVPHYRVVADGPIRAIVEARLEHWVLGDDQVGLRALYQIDAGEGFVRCFLHLAPQRLAADHSYEVGVGIRELPSGKIAPSRGVIALEGVQTAALGLLGLALYYDPNEAALSNGLFTPEGANQAIVFQDRLRPGSAVDETYAAAAAWAGSGIAEPVAQLLEQHQQVILRVEVSGERLERTPHPARIEGEAY